MKPYVSRLTARLRSQASTGHGADFAGDGSKLLRSRQSFQHEEKTGAFGPSKLTREIEALETIARRVWGPEGVHRMNAPGGVEEMLREIERRIPAAVEGMAATVATIRAALRYDAPARFRAFVPMLEVFGQIPNDPAAEIGVHVEGRNVRLTALGSPGSAGYLESCAAATAAFAELVDELRKGRQVEDDESGIDEQGRPFQWVRFGGPL